MTRTRSLRVAQKCVHSAAPSTGPTVNYRPPTPGRALVMAAGVRTLPGKGLKGGGILSGSAVSIGTTTRFKRDDGAITSRAHSDVVIDGDAVIDHARDELGYIPTLEQRERGWECLSWTVDQHIAYEACHRPAPLVIVACGARKSPTRQRADRLYISTYHALAMRAARSLVAPDRVRILSALHGCATVYQELDPYDMRLGDAGSITARELAAQARRTFIAEVPEVIVLAGRDYADLAKTVWPHALTPLAGSRGIGDQQHRLNRIAHGMWPIHLDATSI